MAGLERIGPYLVYPLAHIDSSQAPIYLTLGTRPTDYDSYRRVLDVGREWWRVLDHPVAWITDTRARSGTPDARTRALYARYLQEIQAYQDRYLVCSAIIAIDAVQRGAMTAIRWQSHQRCPQEFFDELPSAFAWCRTMLSSQEQR